MMSTIVPASTLINAIQSSLTIPIRSHSETTPKYDLYEVYLFGLCIQAAETIGMNVSFRDATGAPTKSLVLRTSPSSIWSKTQQFTHATLSLHGSSRLEVHLGIYVRAGSGVSHEADIVVIEATEAARARVQQNDPRVNQAAIVIEAKFYSTNVRLRTGREFLGLVADFGSGSPIFVSSSPGGSVHRLLSYRSRSGHFELIPESTQENELKSQIATKLRDYLARHP
jgi:hypothetical protein